MSKRSPSRSRSRSRSRSSSSSHSSSSSNKNVAVVQSKSNKRCRSPDICENERKRKTPLKNLFDYDTVNSFRLDLNHDGVSQQPSENNPFRSQAVVAEIDPEIIKMWEEEQMKKKNGGKRHTKKRKNIRIGQSKGK